MPMGSIQKQKFETWLAGHAPQHTAACALCGQASWAPGEIVEAHGLSGIMAHMAQLVCQSCGHTLLFDARKAGMI